jgi:hypothetical protein
VLARASTVTGGIAQIDGAMSCAEVVKPSQRKVTTEGRTDRALLNDGICMHISRCTGRSCSVMLLDNGIPTIYMPQMKRMSICSSGIAHSMCRYDTSILLLARRAIPVSSCCCRKKKVWANRIGARQALCLWSIRLFAKSR